MLNCNEYPVLANFAATYQRKGKKGKVHLVRKTKYKANKNLIRASELLGGATGLAAGAKAGEFLVKLSGRNGVIRQSAMAGGGLAGAGIAMMLASKVA